MNKDVHKKTLRIIYTVICLIDPKIRLKNIGNCQERMISLEKFQNPSANLFIHKYTMKKRNQYTCVLLITVHLSPCYKEVHYY